MTQVCEFCQHEPTFKARELQQAPYIGLWQAMVARIADISPDVPVYKRDLDRWLVELWNEQPDMKAAQVLRTTRYGREGESE